MRCPDRQSDVGPANGRGVGQKLTIGVLSILLGNAPLCAQEAGATDPVERAVAFITLKTEATELLAADKPSEGLAKFQHLSEHYADLDEDGYVALSIGDCLAVLARDDEARAAYEATAGAHPELAETVAARQVELALVGEVGEALIDQLRAASEAEGRGKPAANWQLARALQKQAKSLLAEAAVAFRFVAEHQSADSGSRHRSVLDHTALLDEQIEDLGLLIERTERLWGSARGPGFGLAGRPIRGTPGSHRIVTEKLNAAWVVRSKGDRQIEFRMIADPADSKAQITANGRPIELTGTQKRLVQHHRERINRILLEAAAGTDEPTR